MKENNRRTDQDESCYVNPVPRTAKTAPLQPRRVGRGRAASSAVAHVLLHMGNLESHVTLQYFGSFLHQTTLNYPPFITLTSMRSSSICGFPLVWHGNEVSFALNHPVNILFPNNQSNVGLTDGYTVKRRQSSALKRYYYALSYLLVCLI